MKEPNTLVPACEAKAKQGARAVSLNAVAPYSRFPVGAVVRTLDGSLIPGCNVENASYGLCMCAERNALFAAAACGYEKDDIVSLTVYTPTDQITTPCGACRQVMAELMNPEAIVRLTSDRETKYFTVADLLPEAFSLDEKAETGPDE